MLDKFKIFYAHFCKEKCHEKPNSTPLTKFEPSKISYNFMGVCMIKYTARECI